MRSNLRLSEELCVHAGLVHRLCHPLQPSDGAILAPDTSDPSETSYLLMPDKLDADTCTAAEWGDILIGLEICALSRILEALSPL